MSFICMSNVASTGADFVNPLMDCDHMEFAFPSCTQYSESTTIWTPLEPMSILSCQEFRKRALSDEWDHHEAINLPSPLPSLTISLQDFKRHCPELDPSEDDIFGFDDSPFSQDLNVKLSPFEIDSPISASGSDDILLFDSVTHPDSPEITTLRTGSLSEASTAELSSLQSKIETEDKPLVVDSSIFQSKIEEMIKHLNSISKLATDSALQPDVVTQVSNANQIVASILECLSASSQAPLSPGSVCSGQTSLGSPVSSAVSTLSVKSFSHIEPLWYADRPFPTIDVSIVDSVTHETALEFAGHIKVSLLDGDGCPCDRLGGQAASHDFLFPIVDGQAQIAGIRFSAVSSKYGGHFQLRFEAVAGDAHPVVEPLTSSKIQVLSYRLFHAPKLDFSKLRPSDPLSKVKGIGSMYAKRFAAIGVETVENLAELEIDSLENDSATCSLLELLRKDRGALTLAKLNTLIAQARETVARAKQANVCHK